MPRKEVDGAPASLRRIYGLAAAGFLLVAVAVSSQLGCRRESAPTTGSKAEGLGSVLVRRCADCKKVFECSMDEARSKGYLDIEGIRLIDQGKKCPACGKETLEIAQKCPKDGTVFVPDLSQGSDSKAARCPKCGWNPYPQ